MRILTDYHHADLAESFHLTLNDRFGWKVYHPYGMEWFERDYWQFERKFHGDAVARQYLLGIWDGATGEHGGIVSKRDTRHPNRWLWGASLDWALDERWDVIISSVPDNAPGFRKLARETGAAWGVHIGNQWGDEAWELTPDFAIVTTTSPIPSRVPHAVVHQEFSTDIFRYEPPQGFGPVRSFVNCFPETPEYPQFQSVARAAPEFEWEVFGALGTGQPDEFTACGEDIHGVEKVADAMRGAGAIWHAKHWSDGFGHVIHNAFAVGRPVFGYQRYYADKLAGPLWIDGVTSYDVESRSLEEIFGLIRRLRDDPEHHLRMCEAAAKRFREVVDFDEDAAKIRQLLEAAVAVTA